MAIGLIDTKI